MNRPDLHVGDFGTAMIITVLNRSNNKAVPLGDCITMVFIFTPPNEEMDSFERDVVLYSPPDGTDGKLLYIIQDGDFDVAGDWMVQAFVTSSSGQWHSDIETFEVGENLSMGVS